MPLFCSHTDLRITSERVADGNYQVKVACQIPSCKMEWKISATFRDIQHVLVGLFIDLMRSNPPDPQPSPTPTPAASPSPTFTETRKTKGDYP